MSAWEHSDTPTYVRGRNDGLFAAVVALKALAARKAQSGSKAQAAGRWGVADARFEEARVLTEEACAVVRALAVEDDA